ncbi:hypothetical protein GJU40_10615 [Bacillus lacus]|uniref:YqhG family protein n=1 Tax=Metabacillus lacus TaxID=1983721 RepID=A0A7X2IZN5_9BACI|nr:YqhG family protein [Metabacillus lacus]MRX72599.1 hypothetical protein [Metabacillus lacus]
MQQQDIHQYLERFFTANGCEIVHNSQGLLETQLSISMDKELMNRPFYWHYLEKTGGIPNPMKLSLITDKEKAGEDAKGEFMHFGAPRLHQIFDTTRKLAGYIRLYEQADIRGGSIPLHPWLGVNMTVSYQCDMKKDDIYSMGIHLISGTILENFQDKLEKLNLTPKIPDYCFTMSPLIKPKTGVNRLFHHIEQRIQQQDHSWAKESLQRWNADQMLLQHFYEDCDEKPQAYHLESAALKELYEPNVTLSIHNGGIFYLAPNVQLF